MNEIVNNLWISDIQDAREGNTSQFDVVVTICQDNISDNISDSCEYFYYPLSDGPAPRDAHNPGIFSYMIFSDAVDTIIRAVKRGENTLVHCHAGSSRSVMAATAALSVVENLPYGEAARDVRAARPNSHPSPEIVEFAKEYVENHAS